MEIRDLLVHLDGHETSDKRFRLAVELAARHGSRLTGVFAVIDRDIGAARTPSHDMAQRLERIRREFVEKTVSAGVQSRWISALSASEREVAKAVLAWASSSDVAIVGQENPSGRIADLPRDLPEFVILHAGRPVLVVPFACRCETIGERILVAFNGEREATRALNDAIPFLKKAGEIRIALVNPHDLREGEHDVTERDVVDHLSCHDIDAKIERLNVENVSVMDMLLARVAEEGKDMLVMGAYGHLSFPRLLRGSATRHILEHMTVPTLLSH